IRFETAHTAMSYLSYALRRDAYMGVGRNLSYHKSLFFAGKGFNCHMHIKSGDDDLFVNQNATKNNVRISIHPDAHMLSVPKNTRSTFYREKARHARASSLYKGRHKKMRPTQLITALLYCIWLSVGDVLFPAYCCSTLAAYFLSLI